MVMKVSKKHEVFPISIASCLIPIPLFVINYFADIAVGAPYEGDGAVYIFRGQNTESGIEMTDEGEPKYSQRIYARDLTSAPGLTSFGYSLAGGMDMDGNGYKDLAVGGFESDMVRNLPQRIECVVYAIILLVFVTSRLLFCALDQSFAFMQQ